MDRQSRIMSKEQMQLLSEIFRIIAKEITCDEDKYGLAPGEIGIDYNEGCIYIRNPHTGELFSPNSISHLKQILTKYNTDKNTLNADYVSNIRFYSNISQLTQLGISLSADSIIRQMEYPAILMSPVEYENYTGLGFPSNSGMLLVHKISPEYVTASFYDNHTMSTYEGRYNPFKQYFEGWYTTTPDTEYIETVGGGDRTSITLPENPEDMAVIAIRVTSDLNPGAEISTNGGAYLPIYNMDGTPLGTTITANNIIMLIYDKAGSRWLLANSSESSVVSVVNVLKNRVDEVTTSLNKAIADYQERVNELKRYTDSQVETLKTRPGVISEVISTWTATSDNVDTISAITGFDAKCDKLIINYRQTILRNGLDYIIEDTGSVVFKDIRFSTGDVLQFIVLKQASSAK